MQLRGGPCHKMDYLAQNLSIPLKAVFFLCVSGMILEHQWVKRCPPTQTLLVGRSQERCLLSGSLCCPHVNSLPAAGGGRRRKLYYSSWQSHSLLKNANLDCECSLCFITLDKQSWVIGRIMTNFFLQWKKADVAKTESSEVPKIECSLRMKQRKVNGAGWCASVKPILLHRPQKTWFISEESSLSFGGYSLFGFSEMLQLCKLWSIIVFF